MLLFHKSKSPAEKFLQSKHWIEASNDFETFVQNTQQTIWKCLAKVQWYCRFFSSFIFAALWIWNWSPARNFIWTWMMWLGLVNDVKGSQRVVGREHKRAFQPKKDSSLYCIFRIVSELSPSFKLFFQVIIYVFHYWRQQFIGERTRILDAWITMITILFC